ncbi:cytochrome c peroxidase [Dyella sp. OK004]|uniref:cytochrome-c peroxidase n=1 Tax=Dyella sp. OK004 TaxID=1855292 RepID=UPI0008E35939|nr:cytochrome-c peroxidase [Dyella sp. OK004]SFS17233.1 cytochrome c peroxidase [Dyella sp. OK004]
MDRLLRAKYAVSVVLTMAAFSAGAQADELQARANALFKPIPAQPPALPGNQATAARVALGKALYFDRRLSKSQQISCNSCHDVGTGGADQQRTSIGHNWQRGPRNSPTTFNAAYNFVQFWDGRAKDLAEQAGGPMQNPLEMANTPDAVVATLKSIPDYLPRFKAAFPGTADPITLDNATSAIAVFEATLVTPNAPFDKYLRGDANALTHEQKEGLRTFMDKGCIACHRGVNIGGEMYAKFGLIKAPGSDIRPAADKGRFAISKSSGDEFVYKVPTLRNITLTAPYFHSGQVRDLGEAVKIMGEAQLGQKLSDTDVNNIVLFLGSLTGAQPKVDYPVLPPSGPDTPAPPYP